MPKPTVGWPSAVASRYRAAGYWQDKCLFEPIWATARQAPDAVAVVDGARRITYSSLAASADALAAALRARGISKGEVVLVQLPNCAEFVVLLLACLRLGVRPVLAVPGLRSAELRSVARRAGAVAIAVPDTYRGFDHQQLALEMAGDLPALREALVVGVPQGRSADLRRLMSSGPGAAAQAADWDPLLADDVAVLLLSGATTGPPKIIPRTHQDYGYNMRRCAELAGMSAASVYLAVLPVAHNFGLACPGVLGALVAGARVVLSPTARPDACFGLIESEQVTMTSLVPAVARRWLAAAARTGHDLSTLAVLQVGGEMMPAELAIALSEAFPATLQQTFGMAEGLVTFTRLDDPPEVVGRTQGRPICADDEIMLVDERGRPVPAEGTGRLLVRGPYTIRGYYRSPEDGIDSAEGDTAFTPDGWYRTGDLAHWDHAGNLVIDGRAKDVIIRAGEKVSAAEVERLVMRVPGVARAAAVAVPSTETGEAVCVFVVAAEVSPQVTLEGIRAALRAAGTAAYKLPERLELLSELPLTPVGKVDKSRLSRMLLARLFAVQADQAGPDRRPGRSA